MNRNPTANILNYFRLQLSNSPQLPERRYDYWILYHISCSRSIYGTMSVDLYFAVPSGRV